MLDSAFVDESAVFSDRFTDVHLGGSTFGVLVQPGTLSVTIEDAPDPADGVLLTATGGVPGDISLVNVCGVTVFLTDGDAKIETCGS